MNDLPGERTASRDGKPEPAFRFSLRSLLIFVTAAALLFAVAPWFIELSTETKFLVLGGVQFVAELCFWPFAWRSLQRKRRYPPGDDGDPGRSLTAEPEKPAQSARSNS